MERNADTGDELNPSEKRPSQAGHCPVQLFWAVLERYAVRREFIVKGRKRKHRNRAEPIHIFDYELPIYC